MNYKILHQFPPPELERAWRDCLSRVDCPSHYNAPEYFWEPYWRDQRKFAVLAIEDASVRGILTGLRRDAYISCGLASRPQICFDSSKDRTAIVDALVQGLLVEAWKAELVDIYTWAYMELPALTRSGFKRRRLMGNVVLDLTQGPDALFRQFPKGRRRNIRFAEKNGVEVHEATTVQDIRDAYEIYRTWFQTQRKEIQGKPRPFEVFEKAAHLTGNRMTLLARVSDTPVAMNIFRFFPGGLFESAANSSLDAYQHLKPNDLLQWRGIEWACRHGMRRHSLGGAHPFLRRFGGAVIPILRYRLDRTFLRRHELRETVRDAAKDVVERLPGSIRWRIKSLAGKEIR